MGDRKTIDAMWDDSPVDVSTEVNFIWSIANKLRGPYRSDKYKDVIIPMTIIRRFECALAPTKAAVVAKFKENPNFPAKAMQRISGFQFYNTSEFDLAELVNDADHIAANFKSYLQGFSANVLEILMSKERGLNFGEEIDKMDKNNRLLSVVKAFSELDLNPRTIDNVKMGYIFEELIRKFSENAEAGDHYTGRDIIKLMVNILLAEGCDDIFDDGKVITILDQACGTGGMLSTSYNFIKRYNPSADVRLFGQEINPESYAMCLAEMLIKGQNAENICYQDTMKADRFKGTKMRFVLENPPFGQPWGGKDAAEGVEDAVNAEFQKGFDGRWGAGLPGTGDMQLLFLQSAIDKMDENFGRAAIIENGSPLTAGGTASGESQIRRWMLESDLIEAIIALPMDLFYNTGIATYIWVLSKNKRPERKGKVQLIDASQIFHKLRKALGDKKNEISPEDRSLITKLYADFSENEYCRIFRNEEFIYREFVIMQPLQRSYAITDKRIDGMISGGSLSSIYDEAKVNELENSEEQLSGKELKKLENFQNSKPLYDLILQTLRSAVSEVVYLSPEEFLPILTRVLATVTSDKKILGKIAEGLSVMDKSAIIQRDRKGKVIYDKGTKDTIIVGFEEDIDTYMAREILPHIPDAVAFFEENLSGKKPVIKTGAEIPFTRFFYKYQTSEPSDQLQTKVVSDVQGLISVLDHYRNAVLTETSSTSMRPLSEMQDSGIEYVGAIPAHWKIHPVYFYFGERKNKNSLGLETNLLSLSYGKIIRKDINTSEGLLPESFNTYNIIEAGDIIIRPTDLQNDKRSLRTGLATEHGIITSAYIALMPIKPINSAYFRYLLHAFDVMKVFYNMGNGVRQGLNFTEFSRFMVFEPPIEEQNAIVKYLDAKCDEIDAVSRHLDILEDYKRSLIFEYVTGKKEVPSA